MIVINESADIGLRVAVITGESISIHPSEAEQVRELMLLVQERSTGELSNEALRQAVRQLLKRGGFKPSGRSKPASEYLAQAAREGRFPFINNLVDCNNYLSLLTGLPMSLLDADVAGDRIVLRTGRAGEQFVFNSAGQVIDIEGLICACREDGTPLGNPVKDSMEAKLGAETKNVVAVVYAPVEGVASWEACEIAGKFAHMLSRFGGASSNEIHVL
ncbi:MAG: phenylalanine--tRNA ligase beta subunit-related protein [Candidatus Eremiobacteraeota bacterium]|nr:phenylalanine--tRNA ligase beta subunit-related protein [Candidatus Eremiobacteraeota bacterium]